MNAEPATHPTLEQLSAYVLGKLTADDVTAVHRHLEACAACRQAATSIPADSFVNKLRSVPAPVSGASATPAPPVERIHSILGDPFRTADSAAATPPPPEDLGLSGIQLDLPPALIDHPKFRLLRELGRGGMGVVYQAEHRLMKRTVAIKVLNQRLLDHPSALARFHQEVEAAAQLSHPNIVTAHDAEQAGDLHLLVMEYVEGQSLAQVLHREGPLPVGRACQLVLQAAQGLQHAFEKKMVHRDVKPQNLMLTREGVVKVLDFGLARLAERPADGGLTHEGVVMGTPHYMAPEQATDSRRADIRADIYSLGCTLYALLIGQPPFGGETAMQIILAHLDQEAAPPHQQRADVPEALSAVVAKMMAKKPEDRYQTAAEVTTALAPFCPSDSVQLPTLDYRRPQAGEDNEARLRPARARRRMAAILAGLAVLAVGGWLLSGTIFKVVTPDGTIVLDIDQAGAEVVVDGGKITITVPGDNKPVEIKLEPGQHKLRISKDGFVAVTREIELKMGKAESIKIRLEPVKVATGPADTKGFVPLFNGKNLTGWVADGDCAETEWKADASGIAITGGPLPTWGFLLSKQDYTNFVLRLQFQQMTEGAKSGIVLRGAPGLRVGRLPYQCKVNLQNPENTGAVLWSNNSVYQNPTRPAKLKTAGQWNGLEVELRGQSLRVTVNGECVQTIDLDAFADRPTALAVLKQPSGRIGLQKHLGNVRFRKIEIKELPPPKL